MPLFDRGGSTPSLELHSSPVHLATRSLSARTLHTATTSSTASSVQSSTVSLPSSSKRSSLGSQASTTIKSEKSDGKRHSAKSNRKSKVRNYYCVVSLIPRLCSQRFSVYVGEKIREPGDKARGIFLKSRLNSPKLIYSSYLVSVYQLYMLNSINDNFQVGGKSKQATGGHSSRNTSSHLTSSLAKDVGIPTLDPVRDQCMNEERNDGNIATTASAPAAGSVKGGGGGGFNIAEHLQKNADMMDKTDGSLSPEINQFLQDISSVVQTLSPDHGQQKEHTSDGKSELKSQPSPRHKSRPKLAANFSILTAKSKDSEQVMDNSNSHSPIPDSTTTARTLDPHVAASRIQQWYRQNKSVKQTAQVHNLLASKRDELNRSRSEELQKIQLEVEARELKEREREKRRAAKMQAARRAAIEDLKRKREEKRERAEKIAQEEIVSGTYSVFYKY